MPPQIRSTCRRRSDIGVVTNEVTSSGLIRRRNLHARSTAVDGIIVINVISVIERRTLMRAGDIREPKAYFTLEGARNA